MLITPRGQQRAVESQVEIPSLNPMSLIYMFENDDFMRATYLSLFLQKQ